MNIKISKAQAAIYLMCGINYNDVSNHPLFDRLDSMWMIHEVVNIYHQITDL